MCWVPLICSEGFSHLTHGYCLVVGSLAPDRGEEGLMGSDGGDLRVMIENGMEDLPDGTEQVIFWIGCTEGEEGCADGDRLCSRLRAVFTVTGCVHGYGLC
jgi:hypothetical protein